MVDIYSKINKYKKDDIDYEKLYENNISSAHIKIQFNSEIDLESAVKDYYDLDDEIKIMKIIKDNDADLVVDVELDLNRVRKLMESNVINAYVIITLFSLVEYISCNHNALFIDDFMFFTTERKIEKVENLV